MDAGRGPCAVCGLSFHQCVLLREALFPSVGAENLVSVLLILLLKIIDFCEADLEGGTRLLDIGSLSLCFSRIHNLNPVNEDND